MTTIGSPSPFLLGGEKSYDIARSLRFNRSDNSYLSRTPSSAGNRKTWTYSVWVKLGQNGINTSTDPGNGLFLSCGAGSGGQNMALRVTNNGYIGIDYYGIGGYYSTGRLRDPGAWYHCVWVMDTTESTAANRMKVYVNGTLFYNNQMNLSQNDDTPINNNSLTTIGVYPYNTSHGYRLDGCLTEVNFIDGQALDPSYFAETDATTGQWNPKEYTGSYGTNGFYLNFSDNSNNAAIGTDYSGNSNNFTTNNIASSHDTIIDTPTLNFATLDPLSESGGAYSQGNLKVVSTADPATSTIGFASGKFYFETYVDATGAQYVGVIPIDVGLDPGRGGGWGSHGAIAYRGDGQQYSLKIGSSSSITSYGASYTAGDIIGCAVDIDNDTVTFYKNGVSQGNTTNGVSYISPTGATDGIYGAIVYCNGGNNIMRTNFGQDSTFQGTASAGGNTDANGIGDFKYTVPTGYLALCAANLPEPAIKKGNKHFNTLLWSGNATTSDRSITGLDFQPDWAWTKTRNFGYHHALFDSVRGPVNRLMSDQTFAENGASGGNLASFDNDGITWDYGSGNEWWNLSGKDYVAWNWNAGDTDSKTYTVTVVNDGGNKYRLDGFGTSAVTLSLAKGGTYTFNYPSAHPLRFSTTSDGTHGGGSEYTSGVSTYGSSITITVAANAPTLYYYCSQHSGMGGQVNPTTTLGSSNFDGSRQATTKVNTTSGFSIISWTGTGSNATIGHGLGVAPSAIILKARDRSDNWWVYHKGLSDPSTKAINLNLENAEFTPNTSAFNPSAFTSSVFGVLTDGSSNASGEKYIAYAFSEVAGYSKFGKYTANGNSNGIFVHTGFTPAWLLTKRTNSSASWEIHDNQRPTYNPHSIRLLADTSGTEATSNHVDFVSNGFKIRNSFSGMNGSSGDTYIYLAFAKAPFKYARGM